MNRNIEILKKFIGEQNQRIQNDISKQGYKDNSPYRNNPFNIIQGTPQGTPITMKGVSTPLIGIDEYGNKQYMQPGQEYQFPGSYVKEIPIAQMGGAGIMYSDRDYAEGGDIEYNEGPGPKKPIYVNSKNDPRYKAYQDSLDLYNSYKNVKKAYESRGYETHYPPSERWINVMNEELKKPLPNKIAGYKNNDGTFYVREINPSNGGTYANLKIPMQLYNQNIKPIGMQIAQSTKEEDSWDAKSEKNIPKHIIIDKNSIKKKIKDKSNEGFIGSLIGVNATDALPFWDYSNVKPQQQVIVKPTTTKQTTTKKPAVNTKKKPIVYPNNKTIVNPTKLNVEGLQPMSVGLQDVDNGFETNLNIPTPVQRQPKGYKFKSVEGGNETSGYINSPEELKHYQELQKLYSNGETKNWLGTPNSIEITPQYQMGGKTFPKFNINNYKKKENFNPKKQVIPEAVRENTKVTFRDEKGKQKEANPNTPINYRGSQEAFDNFRKRENIGYTAALLSPLAVEALPATVAAATPYVESAMATQLPGLASIPGATFGNALTSYFATHGLINAIPDSKNLIKNPSWGNVGSLGMDALEVAPIIGPATKVIGEGLNTAGKALGTEEGLLSNAYKLNPWAFKPNPEAYYRGIGKSGFDQAIETGVIGGRPNSTFGEDVYMSSMLDVAKRYGKDFRNPFNKNFFVEGAGNKTSYIAEIPRTSLTNPNSPIPYNVGTNQYPTYFHEFKNPKPIPLDDVKLLKEHWLQGYKHIEVPKTNFKSEIDWGKWNAEIPSNQALMQEYNAIEQQSKANGSWMKNYDGSIFQGTPEQFVQQNSKNFKKAFPKGLNEVYRGVGPANNNPDFSKGFIEGDKSIFTANKELAKSYAWGKEKENILTPFSSSTDSGIYHLGFPKGDQINYNTMLSDWTDINLSKGSNKLNLEMNLEHQKNALKRYLKNYEGSVDDDLISHTENRIKDLEQYIKDFDNISTNHEELKKMRNVLGDVPSTDDIAAYLPKTNLNNITLQNVIDGGLGDVTIVNNRIGNYLKSMVGNNGIFDMNNPNIYKALIPPVVGIGTAAAIEKKKIGGRIQTKQKKALSWINS